MNRKCVFIVMLIIFISCMGFASASDSSDTNCTFEDIQTKVDAAIENSVIELDEKYSGEKEITVSKSLTIQGKDNGTTLNGKNATRAFNVGKADVTFKNLIFKDCVSNKGGAVYSQGNLIFINCTFIDNSAVNGGAIYSHGNLTIKKTSFINNGAGNGGGAIYSYLPLYKSASKSKYGNVKIEDSTFTYNQAENGGAIFFDLGGNLKSSKFGNLNVNDCEFIQNVAENFGGALYFCGISDYGKLTVKKSRFDKNTANEGAAIEIVSSDLLVQQCDFTNNKANSGALYICFDGKSVIEKSNFINNTASKISSIMIYSNDVTVTDCTFKLNSVGVVNCEYDSKLTINSGKSKVTYTKNVVLDNSMKKVTPIIASAKDLVYTYDSDGIFTVSLKNKYNDDPVGYYQLSTKCNGKKSKQFYKPTNAKGVVHLKLNTRLAVGTYKVTFISEDWGTIESSGITITVKKAKTTVKAPKITAKYKKSEKFKIKVKHAKTKNPVAYTKVKVKVFTGKKAKTYTIKTNDNGIAKLNTKKLTKGSHKVIISSGNGNYKISAKSKIIIK